MFLWTFLLPYIRPREVQNPTLTDNTTITSSSSSFSEIGRPRWQAFLSRVRNWSIWSSIFGAEIIEERGKEDGSFEAPPQDLEYGLATGKNYREALLHRKGLSPFIPDPRKEPYPEMILISPRSPVQSPHPSVRAPERRVSGAFADAADPDISERRSFERRRDVRPIWT